MPYKVVDIYKDLPLTNCGDCGRGSCFAFATAVFLEGAPITECPHLSTERVAEMKKKLAETLDAGEGTKPKAHQQALDHLLKMMEGADLEKMAGLSGCVFTSSPKETAKLTLLGLPHDVTRVDVVCTDGEPPSVWVKIFLYIYLTRATGAEPLGEWVAYRELPNSVSKAKSFEECAQTVADHFAGDPEGLVKRGAELGGELIEFGSADIALRFMALPRVGLLFLFWKASEEFEARGTMLVDRGVMEYLDLEALVFLGEAFAQRMRGLSLAEVIT